METRHWLWLAAALIALAGLLVAVEYTADRDIPAVTSGKSRG